MKEGKIIRNGPATPPAPRTAAQTFRLIKALILGWI